MILQTINTFNLRLLIDAIVSVRKLAKPPHLIMRIMDAVLLLFQRHVESVTLDPDRPCPKPSWHEALKLMSATNILQGLLTFPKVKFRFLL